VSDPPQLLLAHHLKALKLPSNALPKASTTLGWASLSYSRRRPAAANMAFPIAGVPNPLQLCAPA